MPGILLVCGLLDLVRHAYPDVAPRSRLALTFPAFCVNDEPIELAARPASEQVGGRWEVRASQGEQVVCQGWIGRLGRARPVPPPVFGGEDAEPIRAELVHRTREDNIAIGPVRQVGGRASVPVLAPRRGHFLDQCDSGLHSPEKLIEAARQLTTVIPHEYGGHPAGSKFLWLSVAVDLPHGITSAVPMAFRFEPERNCASRYRFNFELVVGDMMVGRVVSECAVLTAESYRLLRGTRP